MGGFPETPPPPAPDYPPDNAIDPRKVARDVILELKNHGVIPDDVAEALDAISNPWVYLLGVLARLAFPSIMKLEKYAVEQAEPFGEELTKTLTEILHPLTGLLGNLTQVYVGEFVDAQKQVQRGGAGGKPGLGLPAAVGLFDGILSKLGFIAGGANPRKEGAGDTNAQFLLGSLVSLHLTTWAVDIISNLTGVGIFKFIHSFDNVITGSLGATVLRRQALKPYLTKFMAEPLTRDLNIQYPIDSPAPSSLIKAWLRDGLSREELLTKLRSKGFDEQIAVQLMQDTMKELPVSTLVELVRLGKWSENDAVEQIVSTGFPKDLARTLFVIEARSLVQSIERATANDIMNAYADRRLNASDARLLLEGLGFTRAEVTAFMNRGGTQREFPRRLSYSQIRSLYQEGLIDLGKVTDFLQEEGYTDEDADLLVLLEFTRKEDREQRRAELRERRRIALEAQLGFAEEARAAREAELQALGGVTS
jgi:hypothetical protein